MDPVWPSAFQPQVVRDAYGERLTTYVLALEAWRRNLKVSFTDSRIRRVYISDTTGRTMRFIQSRPQTTTTDAHASAKNKHRANQLMDDAGLPVPKSVFVNPKKVSASLLMQQAKEIGYPVVLKPQDGAMGQGVFSNIKDSSVLEQRYKQLWKSHPSAMLVLESHVPGEDYRVLVFSEHYIAACKRVPANIVGDGVSTVQDLIDAKNTLRRKNPFLSKGLIKPDQEITDYLRWRGHDYDSVPAEGEYVQLRGAANASAGGDVIDVTDWLPTHIQDAAVQAVQAVPGLGCAGVDVLFDEESGRYTFLEFNSQPQIGVNMYPTHGTGVDVPKKIIDICFPESERAGESTDERLSLNLQPVLAPLATGHASEVTLAPIPQNRYRMQRFYECTDPSSLTQRQRDRILKASRDHSVAGSIRIRRGASELLVGGSFARIEKFVAAVETITGVKPQNPRQWKGMLPGGFTIQK